MVGVADVHPVEIGTIAPGREDLEVVDGQPGAFAVNLRPHARVAQGEVADGHSGAAEDPQEGRAEGFLAAHVQELSLAVDLALAVEDQAVRLLGEEEAFAQGLGGGLRGHPVGIVLGARAAEQRGVLVDVEGHLLFEDQRRREKFPARQVNRAAAARAGVDGFLQGGGVEGRAIAHRAVLPHVEHGLGRGDRRGGDGHRIKRRVLWGRSGAEDGDGEAVAFSARPGSGFGSAGHRIWQDRREANGNDGEEGFHRGGKPTDQFTICPSGTPAGSAMGRSHEEARSITVRWSCAS